MNTKIASFLLATLLAITPAMADEINILGLPVSGDTIEGTAPAVPAPAAEPTSDADSEAAEPTSLFGRILAQLRVARESLTAPETAAVGVEYVGTKPEDHHQLNQHAVAPHNKNACGTTSLSMILADEGLLDGTVAAAQELDQRVRPWGGFTSTTDIRDEAKRHGMHCSRLNGSSVDELHELLAGGNRVMAMIDGGSSPHWVVALGIETDKATGEQTVFLGDPGRYVVRRLSRSEFEGRWHAPNASMGLGNDILGYQNYCIAFNQDKEELPGDRTGSIRSAEVGSAGVSQTANGFSQLLDGSILSGLRDLAGGVIRTTTAIPGLAGAAVSEVGETTRQWGTDRWNEGGVLNRATGAAAFLGGGSLEVGGDVANFFGNGLSAAGDIFGGLF